VISFSQHERVLVLFETVILLVIAAVVVSTPAAGGYEISVYNGYPLYFIVLLFLSYLIGFRFVIVDAVSTRSGRWVLGIDIAFSTTVVFLSLPAIRGYHLFLTGDAMFHVGKIKNILRTGHVPGDLIYPALHTLVAILTEVIDHSAYSVLYAMGFLFTSVSAGLVYLFSRGLDDLRSQLPVFAFLLIAVLPGSINTSPYSLSSSFVILIIYLVLRSGQHTRYAYKVMAAIVMVALIFMHILTQIYSIVAVGLLLFCAYSYPSLSSDDPIGRGPRKLGYIIIGSAITAYLWLPEEIGFKLASTAIILSPYASKPSEGRLAESDSRSVTEFSPLLPDFLEGTRMGQYLSVLVQNTPDFVDIARIFVFQYGTIFLISLGVGIVFIYSIYKSDRLPYFRAFFTVYLVAMVLSTVGLVVNEWSTVLRRIRGLGGTFGVVIIAVGIAYNYKNTNLQRKAIAIILVMLMFSTFSISFVSTYGSPIQSESSFQRTEMDMTGGDWVFNNSANETEIQEWGFSMRRYSQFRTGGTRLSGSAPPDHFGYDTREYYASEYNKSVYLITTRKGRLTYPKLYSNYRDRWRYSPSDFSRLQRDPTIQSVYTNGEFKTYYHGK